VTAGQLPALLLPARRQRLLQLLQYLTLVRSHREQRLDYVRSRQRQPQEAAHVALRDPLLPLRRNGARARFHRRQQELAKSDDALHIPSNRMAKGW
jgi:hypothetical protein